MAGTGVLPFVRGVDFSRNDFKVGDARSLLMITIAIASY